MSDKKKIVIVGGVAGGASAAARARRLSEESEIIIFERGAHVSFANCGLPYYIGGKIQDRDSLLVAPVERLRKRYRLDVRVKTSVERIDPSTKKVFAKNLETGESYEESYDKLVLSPGASPIRPPLEGIDLPGIYTLRDLGDMDRVKYLVDGSLKSVLIVGGGFIGLELAENMVRREVATTLVELQDQVMPPFDKEMTAPLAEHLRKHGVELILKDSVTGFSDSPGGLTAKLASGRELEAGMVLLCVGVRPDSHLASEVNLKVSPKGAIQVNAHMQTSDPDIYAVGDAIEVTDYVTGAPVHVPLAGPANRQGRIAADHIFGRDSRYRGTQGTAIVGVFDMAAAMTGASEKSLKRAGIDYRKVYLHPVHHASYYPEAESMALKLLFAPDTGRVLGGQAVGGAGVDKRIDVLATAIQGGMTVFDLEEVELAYAPKYGSAKDPINMAGFIAAGLLRGDQPVQHAEQVHESGDTLILDVRSAEEYSLGHLQGARNISVDELRERLEELPKDRPITVYCAVGMRGYLATRILLQEGFQASNLSGGYRTYEMYEGEPWTPPREKGA